VLEVPRVYLERGVAARQFPPDFPDGDEPFRLAILERLEQDAVDDGEDSVRTAVMA
jgi:hypothetical protein